MLRAPELVIGSNNVERLKEAGFEIVDVKKIKATSLNLCVYAVAEFYSLAVADLTGPLRARRVSRPRQTAYHLAYQLTGKSLPEVGRFFNRDHTTIKFGIGAVAKRMVDHEYRREVNDLRMAILGSGDRCQE